MKKLIILFLSLASFVSYGQQTDAASTTKVNATIRDAAAAGSVTRAVVTSIIQDLIDSKVNRSETLITSGTDTYTISPGYTVDYSKKPQFLIKFVNGNTGAVTINGIALKKNVSSALSSGDITANSIHWVFYDGTNFQIFLPSGGSGSGTVNSGTINQIAYYAGSGTTVSGLTPGTGILTAFAINSGSTGSLLINPTNGSGVLTNNGSGTLSWAAAGGTGTVTNIVTTSPLSGGPITTTGTISIANSAADGSTKGAASFTAADFDATSGNISIDYTNGQSASGSTKGFVSSTDWTTFNNKQPQINGTGFVKATGTTISYDNSTYLTGNQSITLSGDISGTGSTAITTTIGAAKVTNSMLAGSIDLTSKVTGTLPVANGGTGVTASSGASSVMLRDANQNTLINNIVTAQASTATAAGTTTLTVSSAPKQFFTGTTTQTIVLPVVSTLPLGHTFTIVNNSTGIVTVQSSGSNVIQAMAANSTLREECISTSGTGTASWSSLYTVSNPMTTWGDIVYGGDPGSGGVAPLTRLAPGTAGYILSSNGLGVAPSWIAAGGLSGLTTNGVLVATSSTTTGTNSDLVYGSRSLTVGLSSSGTNTLTMGTTGVGLTVNTSTGEHRIASAASFFTSIYANNGEAARFVSATKDFLIGTTTDNSKLTVNGSVAFAYVPKTANYTATISDYTIECTSGTFQVTLPTAVGITGREYVIVNSGAGTITIGTTSSQTFVNVTATPTTLTMATIGARTVISNGANWMLKNSL